MRRFVGCLFLVVALVATPPLLLTVGVATWTESSLPGLAALAPGPDHDGIDDGSSTAAARAVAWALAQQGTPYRWGGEGDGGFDCSGLVQAAFAAVGVPLPRVAQDQFDAGPRLPPGAPLRPGDLVFFGTSSTSVDHVGIVVGPGEMVDAPHTGAVVRVEPIFSTGYIGATRPAP